MDIQTNTQTGQFCLLLERLHTLIRRHILGLDDWKSVSLSVPNLGQLLRSQFSNRRVELKKYDNGELLQDVCALRGSFELEFGKRKFSLTGFSSSVTMFRNASKKSE